MTFLKKIIELLSPIEVTANNVDLPMAKLSKIDAEHAKHASALQDRAYKAKVEKEVLMQTVEAVAKLSRLASLAAIARKHSHDLRLSIENPKDEEIQSKIVTYLKKEQYSKEALDELTVKLLDTIGLKFGELNNIYTKFKGTK